MSAQFKLLSRQALPSLNLEVEEYEHLATGAKHFHLACDAKEKVFWLGLRTFPQDSTGVAHILEHTALCGSEAYPVRDPFFMMTRRSLNTFMNALTSSDWTAYPFASLNTKDFYNLLDVYLDAVFFSRLHPLDFAQEGHRLEFSQADDPNSKLEYKGVVFNEMKGAMSSPVSTLWQTLTKYLFPTTTYHHNSGGEPSQIPQLTYEQLISFYKKHYHPSNAIIFTYGDINLSEVQNKIHQQALSKFTKQEEELTVGAEQRYFAPIKVEEAYAFDEDDLSKQTYISLAWLLGTSTSAKDLMRARLLEMLLLDNSSSPLLAALETSPLGTGPSPITGLEASNYEMSFICGLQGSEPDKASAVEELILTTLEKVAETGFSQAEIEAQLHQLELSQREISGGGMPYGMQLIMAGFGAGVHRSNPVELLDIDTALAELRQDVADPEFLPKLIKDLFLTNPHRLTLTLRPCNQLAKNRQAHEEAQLATIQAGLSAEEQQAIIQLSQDLAQRQTQTDDASLLPKVTLADVPKEVSYPEKQPLALNQPASWYTAGTNGLVYLQAWLQLPQLSTEEAELLPLYAFLLSELGCGERSYQENQALQSQVSGGINASLSLRPALNSEQEVSGYLKLGGKALARNQAKLQQLLVETLNDVRFDELSKIKELITERAAAAARSITGNGHGYAMTAAASQLSPLGNFSQNTSGLAGVAKLKDLAKNLEDAANLTEFAANLAQLHQKLKAAPKQFLLIGEEANQASITASLENTWSATANSKDFTGFSLPSSRKAVKQAWVTNTQVNFCALAFPSVTGGHADAAALTVLGGYLRNNFLHTAIREQGGAYGAGASQDNNNATFRFFSYRDPRLTATLDDFFAAIEAINSQPLAEEKLEEAILGVVSSLDKPASPAGEAQGSFSAELFGRNADFRRGFRAKVLEVSLEDLQRVAKTYLTKEAASYAVITSSEQAEQLDESFERLKV